MPRINITKTDKHKCEYCGNKILDVTYCEITTATSKVIKMHRECALDFAVDILEEFSKDESLKEEVDKKIAEIVGRNIRDMINKTPKEELPPKAHLGVDECSEYIYFDIIDYNTCCGCYSFSDNKNETRYECSSSQCYKRDGHEEVKTRYKIITHDTCADCSQYRVDSIGEYCSDPWCSVREVMKSR